MWSVARSGMFDAPRGRCAVAVRIGATGFGAAWIATASSAAWADEATPAAFSAAAAGAGALLLAALLGLVWWRVRAARDAGLARREPAARAATPMSAAQARAGADVARPPVPAADRTAAPTRSVHSGVEGIDLIQQAEFLSLLGERDAAVALLTAHLDGAGAAEAPVWLKLMQIHRRFGDRQSFEQVRPRYRERFGAEAPPWASDKAATASDSNGASAAAPARQERDRSPTVPGVLLIDGKVQRDRSASDSSRSPGG